VKNRSWPRNEIDYFVLARLESAGLAPSPPAEKDRLLRRAYLDLIGLPPSPAEIDAYLADPAPVRYERMVDRLLASPFYGEHWARHWLDLARYADSNGFQRDGFRELWAYRDWVIRAFNDDMPFDQFTIEQLAGDLLPNATPAQKIATGFNRCPTVNVEAGTDQEENRVNQVLDRVNTTATVWLGSTIQCAQCHDHKYDPISQKEYYQLFAFFNNTEIETQFRSAKATAAIDFVSPSMDVAPPADFEQQRRRLAEQIIGLKNQLGAAQNGNQKKKIQQRLNRAKSALEKLEHPQTLIMRELPAPRDTAVLVRGSFLHPGEPVEPATPAFLHAVATQPSNRLTFARWLVDRSNPLVARVTVNRWWAEFFGHGLVSTPEDFGVQGAAPSHPQLLDLLAVRFMNKGWSMKTIHKSIVMSATYRQSSRLTSELLRIDPGNQLYARGPRFRMDAEMIRDNALAASGLLSLKQGGPPVRPYQPPDVWRVAGLVDNTYQVSEGEDRYRRGIYTVWRRSAPYPSFVAFDAPDRSACTVKRSRSNTPLQALALLNDPVYVEAAQQLARRVLAERPLAGVDDRIEHLFRVCLTRGPQPSEVKVLHEALVRELARLQAHPKAAEAATGSVTLPGGASREELAAWQHLATILLTLDEMITKG